MRPQLMAVLLGLGFLSTAGASPVAAINQHKHMGVATCASSTCHGATQQFKESNVWQNEFARWQEYDPHATKAYQALQGAEGQAIARRFGLGDATQAQVCLDCHADNTPVAMRGERFQIGDGVAYEPWSSWDSGRGLLPLVGAATLAPSPHNSQAWCKRPRFSASRKASSAATSGTRSNRSRGCSLTAAALRQRSTAVR